MLILMSTEGST